MAILYVQEVGHRTGFPAATSWAVTVANAPTAGNVLILSIANPSFAATGVTDAKGNAWTLDKTNPASRIAVFSTSQNVAKLAAGDLITVAFAGSVGGQSAVAVHEFSGIASTRSDQTATGNTTGTARTAGTTGTTGQANELVWAAFYVNGTETAFSTDASYTTPATSFYANAANTSLEFEYQVVAATGTFAPAPSGGVSAASYGVVVTYKEAAGSVLLAGDRGLASTTGRAGGVSPSGVIGARGRVTAAGRLGTLFTTGGGSPGTYGVGTFGVSAYGPVSSGGTVAPPAWTGLSVDGGSGLLPQVDWQVDLTAPTGVARTWTTVATLVRNCSFARSGRSDELQRTSPGTLTMTLDNRADAATGLGLKKGQWVRVPAQWAGVQYGLWQGIITSIQRQWPSAGRDATVTVQAADALYVLRISQMLVHGTDKTFPLTSFPTERADQRIQTILNSVTRANGSLVGTLDPQTDTLDATDVSSTADALSTALAVEGSDNGLLIADPTGVVSYQGRQWRVLNATASVLTLGEAGGVEVSYDDSVSYEDDDSRLANFVSVTPLGASSPQTAADVASEALYWTRHNQTVDRSLLSSDTNLALAAAQYLVARYRDPPPRIPALTLNMVTVPAAQKPAVLSLANSQRVTWKRAAATPIQTDGYVEQIQHTLAPGSSWTTTLQLSPASLEAAWILGDATYGQLGTATALSY